MTSASTLPRVVVVADTLTLVQRRRKRAVLAGGILLLAVLLFSRSLWPAFVHEIFEYVGYGLILLCIAGRTWCALYIGGRKKTVLVDDGPYSLSRNPLYLFSLLGGLGIGLQAGNIATGFAFGLFIFAIFNAVIGQEEAFLRARFPAEFAGYAARVPRWGPRLSAWQADDQITVRPHFALLTFRDALWFLVAIPLIEGIEILQNADWLPVLLQLP
jgi:protein-S-isoprenylcysteine O-methyltransferase Ste14